MINILLQHNADLNRKNKYGNTPMQLAAERGIHYLMINLLNLKTEIWWNRCFFVGHDLLIDNSGESIIVYSKATHFHEVAKGKMIEIKEMVPNSRCN